MLHYIKRNHVLTSYKLDEVTKHFMSGKLKKQKYEGGVPTLEVAGKIKDIKVGRSIILLDETRETVSLKLIVAGMDGAALRFECDLDKDAFGRDGGCHQMGYGEG